jgi:hypothetical protein
MGRMRSEVCWMYELRAVSALEIAPCQILHGLIAYEECVTDTISGEVHAT